MRTVSRERSHSLPGASHLERAARWLARREQEVQVRMARELIAAIRQLNRTIADVDQELEQRTTQLAPALLTLPGCAVLTAAKLLAEIGPVDASAPTRSSHATPASHPWRRAQAERNATASTAPATAN